MSARPLIRIVVLTLLITATAVVWAGPQARLSGKVTDVSGVPIGSAVVTITSPEAPTYEKVIEVDEDGTFRALILDATKNYIFHVQAEGYLLHEEAFKIAVGTTDNEFTFELKTQSEVSAQLQKDLLDQPGYKEMDAGQKLLAAGKTAEAQQKFEEAVEAKPDFLEAWQALLDLVYKSGDNERALEIAKECLDIDDEALQCLAVAANAAENLGLTAEHAEYMATYEELNPDDPATIFNKAVTFLNRMDDQQAQPLLEQCLQVDPDFGKCLFEYGMLLLRTGDMEGAKKQLNRYLEVDPNGADAATAADTVKYL